MTLTALPGLHRELRLTIVVNGRPAPQEVW